MSHNERAALNLHTAACVLEPDLMTLHPKVLIVHVY